MKTAKIRTLDPFFRPKSIAIIGASRNPEKFGHIVLENILAGFKGNIYPVNKGADEILGMQCYRSIKEIKDRIDLAVIVIPAPGVIQEVKNCRKKGVKACIILTSGIDEHKLMKEKGNMRILGPNVIGIYDAYSKVDTIFTQPHRQGRPTTGSISFISQSGSFSTILMDLLASEGIGLSKLLSIGNRIDIDETEILEYLVKDKTTKVIVIYLESTKKGTALFKTLKKASKIKPIIIFKAGKTKAAIKAVSSHTGSLAGQAEIYSAVFKQSHAIEATKIEDLIDFPKMFASQPLPKGNRIQIITNGGGLGIMAIDEMEKKHLQPAQLSEKTAAKIKKAVPAYVSVSNPMDLAGDATTERFSLAINTCLNDKNVDAIIVPILFQISAVHSNIVDILIKAKKYKKPIAICSIGGEFTNTHKKLLEEHGIPTYPTPQRAVKSLQALIKYAKYKGVMK